MQQKSETRAKAQTRQARAAAPKPRENAQDVIRDFFATLARAHGAPLPAAQEKP